MNSLNLSPHFHQKQKSSPEELWSLQKRQYFKISDSQTSIAPLADWKNKGSEALPKKLNYPELSAEKI